MNRFKQRLAAGDVVLGAQLRFGTPAIAELFGCAGYDFLVIDAEHAPQTPVGIQAQLQAIGGTGATPVVRLGQNDPDIIRLYLDMGAMNIMVSLIETADEARQGAEACRYPPAGCRGFGPSRAADFGFNADYFAQANDEVMFLPMIETASAIDTIDEILALPGVDTFIIGPVNLSISLGVPFQFGDARYVAALERVAAAAQAAGKPAGIGIGADPASPDTYRDAIAQGYRVLLCGGDEWMLKASCQQAVESYRQARS